MHATDTTFTGSIPALYESHLVPLIFAPYAVDLARRLGELRPRRVLEIASGTGVVTRAMAATLPVDTEIVATDLNQPMLDHAASIRSPRPIEWRQADAQALPFDDGGFDVVVCQFGTMFFPDRPRAYAEARRVLKPGGLFLFNTWDRIEANDFADEVTTAVARLFPDDPPRFLARTPHGYHDAAAIAADLAAAGFTGAPDIETLAARSNAASARAPAVAYCKGTQLRNEIEARDAGRLEAATDAAEAALIRRFGAGPIDGNIQAHVVGIAR